jgi:hypothetical protein
MLEINLKGDPSLKQYKIQMMPITEMIKFCSRKMNTPKIKMIANSLQSQISCFRSLNRILKRMIRSSSIRIVFVSRCCVSMGHID